VGIWIGTATWKTVWRVLKNRKESQQSYYWVYTQEMKAAKQQSLYSSIFLAALFTITKVWKHSLVDEWIKKMCVCVHLAIKHKDILSLTATWVNLENVMLPEMNKRSQTRKPNAS
jgi:hypothetical protein